MKRIAIYISFLLINVTLSQALSAQQKDTLKVSGQPRDSSTKSLLKQDTAALKFNPRIATRRSILIPGWGQAYNKKYWKIPIIYGALGTTAGIYLYNVKYYKLLRKAYSYRTDNDPSNDTLINPQFIHLSTESIRTYRNSYRQNVDYSILFFLAFWAVNVVDATVDAHLKSFDVNDNISFKFKPGYDMITKGYTIGLVFNLHDKKVRQGLTP
ncbi:MAG: hypothetical protein NVSMB45_04830 [Ginsengibacter sp.]